MTDTTKLTWDRHPATFSKELMPTLIELAANSKRILDPFAGTGKIHRLRDSLDVETVGVEIEPEGANMSEWTIQGDSSDLLALFERESFDAVFTSPGFANRMSDHQKAMDKCKRCNGTGHEFLDYDTPEGVYYEKCDRCKGAGQNQYKRLTYRHTLPVDRELHENNSGRMGWGKKYRTIHTKAWQGVWDVLQPQTDENPHAGLFVLNIKNHYRTKERMVDGEKVKRQELQMVAEWHIETLEQIGFVVEDRIDIKTPGMRYGQNGQVREDNERVYVLRKREQIEQGN
jgi:hypothetical protein